MTKSPLNKLAEKAKVAALQPSKDDVKAMGARIKDNPDGTWTASLSGLAQTRALAEAYRPWARATNEMRMNSCEDGPKQELRRPDGTTLAVHPKMAARMAARQGLKPHESRRPSRRYINGVWYRRIGKDWVVDAD